MFVELKRGDYESLLLVHVNGNRFGLNRYGLKVELNQRLPNVTTLRFISLLLYLTLIEAVAISIFIHS